MTTAQLNPGNVLPVYPKKQWQRHRLTGTNLLPFGIPVPRSRLIPIQVRLLGYALESTVVWHIISAVDDLETYELDASGLEIGADDDGIWVTWKAAERLPVDLLPSCGYWYVRFTVDGDEYYSEVMYLKEMCGVEDAYLFLSACTVDGDDIVFTINGVVSALGPYTYSLERYILGYTQISTNESHQVTINLANAEAQFQIVVETGCGIFLTRQYTVEWDPEAGDVCETLTLTLDNSTEGAGGSGRSWRMVFGNGTQDKGTVLYQTGYEQHYYMEPAWDTPEVQRDVNTTVNGYGAEVARETRTVEVQRFEMADVPDYLLSFLARAGDLASVELEDLESGQTVELENMKFDSRRQGFTLNVGVVSYDADVEAFSGCQDNFTLVE